jgi:GntR family transcriptional repressor for pyruvate dehydrogenase complex
VTRTKLETDETLSRALRAFAESRVSGDVRVAEDIATQLQAFIIDNDVAAGVRLPSERDLAVILNTSRPTVSQAVRVLVVRGLVESRRGSGIYVTRRPQTSLAASVDLMLELDQESVTHLADLRLWMETAGVVEAIARATDDEIEEGERALEGLRSSAGDTAAWMSADTAFHATIIRGAHNPYLSSIYQSVHTTLINYEYRSWIDEGRVPRWLRSSEIAALNAIHDPILQAVKGRDEEAGRIAVLHHHYVMAQHLAASQKR